MLKFDMKDFVKKTNEIVKKAQESAPEILKDGAYDVWFKSQKIVPVQTGLLKATGHVKKVEQDGEKFKTEVAYGGPVKGYEQDYVYYAEVQERIHEYIADAASGEIFPKAVANGAKEFLRSPTKKYTSNAPEDPPFENQSSSDAVSRAAQKQSLDAGFDESLS